MTIIRRLARVAFGIGVVLLIVSSLLPSEVLPKTGLLDKWQHLVAYVLLMAAFGVGTPVWRRQIFAVVALFALGIAIEGLQSLVPDRQPSALDVVANVIGVLIGLGFAAVFNRVVAIWMCDTAV